MGQDGQHIEAVGHQRARHTHVAMAEFDSFILERNVAREQNIPSLDDNENDNSDIEFDLDEEEKKSETEEELERIIFGDNAGFRERLKSSALEKEDQEGSIDEATGLEALADSDVGLALKDAKIVGFLY